MKYAVLLHLVDWEFPEAANIDLGGGVQICQFKRSPIQKIYEGLCTDLGFDDGEPFLYGSYLLVEPQKGRMTFDIYDVYNDVSRLCNALTICFDAPVGMSRVLILTDFLEYTGVTVMAWEQSAITDFLPKDRGAIKQESQKQIKALWSSVGKLRDDYESYRRLNMALIYFNYSWRGLNLDQVCINLSIVLESLFSPSSNTELSHQISYNACCFIGRDKDDRSRIYKMIKQFYRIRSKLVHGDWPDNQKLADLTPQVFVLCAEILRRILCDAVLLQKFSSNRERLDMFKQWLFRDCSNNTECF